MLFPIGQSIQRKLLSCILIHVFKSSFFVCRLAKNFIIFDTCLQRLSQINLCPIVFPLLATILFFWMVVVPYSKKGVKIQKNLILMMKNQALYLVYLEFFDFCCFNIYALISIFIIFFLFVLDHT